MKAAITVSNREEAVRINAALDNPTVRAFVNIMGALAPLDDHRKSQVLAFVGAACDGRTPAASLRRPLPLDLQPALVADLEP